MLKWDMRPSQLMNRMDILDTEALQLLWKRAKEHWVLCFQTHVCTHTVRVLCLHFVLRCFAVFPRLYRQSKPSGRSKDPAALVIFCSLLTSVYFRMCRLSGLSY